jgi:catechol 2,3-dioxygenase-like lactoylglutathione lyase family enzyme
MNYLRGLDHIIIGVNDLEQATRIFNQDLGLAVSGGGIHPTGGTANRIIVIGDTYLELITIRDRAEAQQSMLDRLAKGDGYLNFVLASNDIYADSKAMTERGISIIGPNAGELRGADGRSRGWVRTDVEHPDLTQRYPFVIQHDSAGEERRRRLAGWTTPPQHPLGATGVLSATLVVANLQEATARFQRIYGLTPSTTYSGEVDGWDAMLISFPPGNGTQSFELATPLPSAIDPVEDAGHLPERGALRKYLQTFGESLCRITLAVTDLAVARQYLDSHRVTYTYQNKPRSELWLHPDHTCGASMVLYEQKIM